MEGELKSNLDVMTGLLGSSRVCVALFQDGRDIVLRGGRSNGVHSDPRREIISLNCIAKLLTAALIRGAVEKGLLSYSGDIGALLYDDSPELRERFSGISLEHLLNHTHGLDSAGLMLPFDRRGFIDRRRLGAAVSSGEPLAAPGALYNYSDVGPWLAGCLLERCFEKPFVEILEAQLLRRPWGIRAHSPPGGSGAPWCPASGAGLGLEIGHLVEFLRRERQCLRQEVIGARTGSSFAGLVVPLTGWSPLERGVYRGWKYHGADWFGHNARTATATTLVRANVAANDTIVVVHTDDRAAVTIASALFTNILAEFSELQMPRPLAPEEQSSAALADVCGTYVNRSISVTIRKEGADLSISVRAREEVEERRPMLVTQLIPATNGVYLSSPPDPDQFTFVLPVVREDLDARYLWNGKSVWRRVQ